MSKKAMKLALKALKDVQDFKPNDKTAQAIKALEEALAKEPAPALASVQEPMTDTDQINRNCWYKTDMTTAQPAPVQETVAWLVQEWSGTGKKFLTFDAPPETLSPRDELVKPVWSRLIFADTAAQPTPVQERVSTLQFTSGHCKEKQKVGGCQLHNLHCNFPACDRKNHD